MSRGTAIKREGVEAIRARLLADEQVHTMIEMRAYEIYRLRGAAPGQEAEDWLQAEAEILKFLMDEEARRSETEALVAQSLARDLSDQFSEPIQNAREQDPAVSRPDAAEKIEVRAPLGLADILREEPQSTNAADLTKPRKSRSRTTTAERSPVARKTRTKKPPSKPKKT